MVLCNSCYTNPHAQKQQNMEYKHAHYINIYYVLIIYTNHMTQYFTTQTFCVIITMWHLYKCLQWLQRLESSSQTWLISCMLIKCVRQMKCEHIPCRSFYHSDPWSSLRCKRFSGSNRNLDDKSALAVIIDLQLAIFDRYETARQREISSPNTKTDKEMIVR